MSDTTQNPLDALTKGAEDKSVLDQVVEAKGNESFKDPEVLAKSVLNADNHIKNLERQLAELRSDLDNRMTAEDALKALDAKADEIANASRKREELAAEQEPTTTGVNPDQVEAIVSEALQKRTQKQVEDANLSQTNSYLVEAYGDEAANEVRKRAAELGYEATKMLDIARENPNAFMALMGQTPVKSTNNLNTSEVNTSVNSFQNNQERNHAFYSKVRKENPKLYYTPSFQREMHKDIDRLGDGFLT